MATPTKSPKATIRKVTAAQAAKMLEKNKVNRNLRDQKVLQYMRSMDEDMWTFCPEPIAFDVDGNLINGQHRLTAQVKLGIEMTWLIVQDAPVASQETIDTGIGRTAADVLHFRGEQNAPLLAAVARFVTHIRRNSLAKGRFSIGHEDIIKTIEAEPLLRRSTEMAAYSKNGMTPIFPSVIGAAHWYIAQHNSVAEADAFVMRLTNLSGEREGSPILALSRRANEIKRHGLRVHSRDMLALVIKAWNYDAQYKTAHKLAMYSRTGEFVLPEPRTRLVQNQDGESDDLDLDVAAERAMVNQQVVPEEATEADAG